MKHQVSKAFLPFISFMHGVYKKKGHNILAFMLDPTYKKYMFGDYLFGSWHSTTQLGASILK
jgi:hypothetical protein